MNGKTLRTELYAVLLLIFLLATDLISKRLVFSALPNEFDTMVISEGVFNFTHIQNDGVIFGLFSGNPAVLIGITSALSACIALLLVLKPNFPWLLKTALVLILGGALGNTVDRIMGGYVRDFIDYKFLETLFNIDFAVGNIADIYVLVGAVLLIFYVVFDFDEAHFKGIRFKKGSKGSK